MHLSTDGAQERASLSLDSLLFSGFCSSFFCPLQITERLVSDSKLFEGKEEITVSICSYFPSSG